MELLGWFPRLKRFGGVVSAIFGGPLATYTGVLLANTAVPSWHEFHTRLPFVFGASATGVKIIVRPPPAAIAEPAKTNGSCLCGARHDGTAVLASSTAV